MHDQETVHGGVELLPRVEPLWYELRRHHAQEFGQWRNELLAAHFEQRLQIAQLEGHYREAMAIVQEAEIPAGAERSVVAPQFQPERVSVK